MATYILKDEEGIKKYDNCIILGEQGASALNSKIKIKILELLQRRPMFISELSEKLGINEQNIYYHMRELMPLLEVAEEKKIRGTIAKKYKPKAPHFCISLSNSFKDFNMISRKDGEIPSFFLPLLKSGVFDAKFVVGSPDPHGQHKARARDGHYAIDLALYLGNFCVMPKGFSVSLDVDIKLKDCNENLIIVGGPITNLIMEEINNFLPMKFVEGRHWALKGVKDSYTDDNIGLIARMKHPHYPSKWVYVIAGIRYSGTKAGVIGLTRANKLVLSHFTGQAEFCAVIQGYDMDGDGKIDSVELLE